jgi:hypothetical protein
MSVDVSTTQSPVAVSVNDTTVSVVVSGGIGPQGPAGGGYTLPAATTSTLGGIIVGSNLTVTANGTLSATGGGAVSSVAGRTGAVTLTTADIGGLGSLATQSGTFSGTSSGTNTGDQTITLTGDVTGSGTGSFAATLAASGATAGTYTSVTVDTKGRVTAGTNPAGYSLPTATASVLGGIKIGSGLSIDGSGVVTASGSTDASTLTTGTLADARLSGNVPLRDSVVQWLGGNSSTGVDVFPLTLVSAGVNYTSGAVYITFFTPLVTTTITSITYFNGTAFSGVTFSKFGLYTYDESTATLVAATASNTGNFASANSSYNRVLSSAGSLPTSYTLTAGTRYGVAVLVVGTTMGQIICRASANTSIFVPSPRQHAVVTNQTDLSSSYAVGSFANTATCPFARLLP